MTWKSDTILSQRYWGSILKKIYWGPDFKRGTEELFWPRGTENLFTSMGIRTCPEPRILNALNQFWTSLWRPVIKGNCSKPGILSWPKGAKDKSWSRTTKELIWPRISYVFQILKIFIWNHVSSETYFDISWKRDTVLSQEYWGHDLQKRYWRTILSKVYWEPILNKMYCGHVLKMRYCLVTGILRTYYKDLLRSWL